MRFNCDLHIHSRYSGGTSDNMTIENLARESRRKGMDLLGTGDCLHLKWLKEIKAAEKVDEGTFELHGTRFVLQTEIQAEKRVHHIIFFPAISAAEGFREGVARHTRMLDMDGRPHIHLSGEEIVELAGEHDAMVGPAHAFTPWTGMYAHFDSLKDCYGGKADKIKFLELGLSADSSYGDMVPELENITFLTNSDAHSPYPLRLAREFNQVTARDITYNELMLAIERKNRRSFSLNVGLPPAEGKYNNTACSACFGHYTYEEALASRWKCTCGGSIKKGVRDRVKELSKGGNASRPEHRPDYLHLVPLTEIIQQAVGHSSPYSKKVKGIWESLITAFGDEVTVLIDTDISDIEKNAGPEISGAVEAFRSGKVIIVPGGGGEYGKVLLPGSDAAKKYEMEGGAIPKPKGRKGQKNLFEY